MKSFFSKLDLRDIKIKPEGSRFPPDADEEQEQEAESLESQVTSTEEDPAEIDEPYHPTTQFSTNGVHHEPEPVEPVSAPEPTRYELDGDVVAVAGDVLKVSARSRPSAVAGAIAGVVRESGRAEVQAIGAGATNQAVKAVAIARDYLKETGIDAICVPAFIDVTIDNEDRTAIRLVVEPRHG